jgi:phosphonoacetate hydrolase
VTRLSLPRCSPAARDRALDVLLGEPLAPIVDLVAWMVEPGSYEVASPEGRVRFRRGTRADSDAPVTYAIDSTHGASPVANQDPSHLGTLEAERASPHPARAANAYPHAFDHLAQLFDHPSAPDLVVLHSGAHYWGDQGGHLGEHGSLGVLQARAPFIAAGAGVHPRGMADASCRLVDVFPTVLALLGIDPAPSSEVAPPLDGSALVDAIAARGGARHVVGILMDGTNPNVLYDAAARGDAPNLARLMAAGTTYRHGAIASMPTVTLANHTSILTGRHPGHHGVLHNAWIDRATGAQVVTNSPTTWPQSMRWLHEGVETIHDAVHRARPGAVSISINEPCDVGADFSVFDLVRRGEAVDRAPLAADLPDATQRFVRPSKDYQWSSRIDHTAVEQFRGIWSGSYRGRAWERPVFSWVNFTLTDAAFHEGGPYSEIAAASVRDTDARIGHLIDAVERSGAFGDTAFVVVADHGMQLADEAVTGDWDAALRAGGVDVRDEGYGFLYLPEP